jgi:hypothetical protein
LFHFVLIPFRSFYVPSPGNGANGRQITPNGSIYLQLRAFLGIHSQRGVRSRGLQETVRRMGEVERAAAEHIGNHGDTNL